MWPFWSLMLLLHMCFSKAMKSMSSSRWLSLEMYVFGAETEILEHASASARAFRLFHTRNESTTTD
jgi:hypothetical protein